MADLKTPHFVTGIGRSGTTIFYELLSYHPEIYWWSTFVNRHNVKMNNRVNSFIDSTLVPKYFRDRIIPTECYDFWDKYFRGFSQPSRDLLDTDVSPKIERSIKKGFTQFPNNDQVNLVKITGWPRTMFLNKIFSDAKFIHIKREGKATVNSFLNVHFWKGYRGTHQWRWGNLSDENKVLLAKYNDSFVALAAIQYKMFMDRMEEIKKLMPKDQFLEIKYEDFVENPVEECKKAISFLGIDWSNKFEKRVLNVSLRDSNYKWKEDLNADQQAILSEILDPVLPNYGY